MSEPAATTASDKSWFSSEKLITAGVLTAVAAAILFSGFAPVYDRWQVRQANQQLLAGCRSGDLNAVRDALVRGANAQAADDKAAMYYAIDGRYSQILRLLLQAGFSPDDPVAFDGITSTTPLLLACRIQDVQSVQILLDAGASPNVSAEFLAVQGSDSDDIPLHTAISGGNLKIIEMLVRAGANLRGSLHRLAGAETLSPAAAQVTHLLLKCGARWQDRVHGQTALDAAVVSRNSDLAAILYDFGAPFSMREAVAFNHPEEVRRMIQDDPSLLTQKFSPGYFPGKGHGISALGLALQQAHRDLAMMLLEAGAPLDSVEPYGATVLHLAVRGGDAVLVQQLLDLGVDPNRPDEDGSVPMLWAAGSNRLPLIRVLLDAGTDIHTLIYGDHTFLHRAVLDHDEPLVQLLLEAGADPNVPNVRDQLTAIDMARLQADQKILSLLQRPAAARKKLSTASF